MMENKSNSPIKILAIIAGIALVLAIPSIWPYTYYRLLRIGVFAIGLYLAYKAREFDKDGWIWVMVIIAILFNPFIPFSLKKDTWIIIDFVTAIIFFVSGFTLKEKNEKLPQNN